jgi:hypothetical protein
MTTHERRGVQGASGRHALGRRRHAADSCAVVRVRLLRRGYGDSTDGSPGAVGGSLATRTAFGPEPIISSIRTSSYALADELQRYAGGRGREDYILQKKGGCLLDDLDFQQHVFRPAADAAGIYFEGFGMHMFRRINVTVRQEVAQRRLKHRSQLAMHRQI